MLRKKREPEAPSGGVADDVIETLKASIQARTEAAVAQAEAENRRQQELRELRGYMQEIATGIGEIVSNIGAARELTDEQHQSLMNRLRQLEDFQRGFSLFMGGEMREEMQKLRVSNLELGELLAAALRGWTQVTMLAEAQGMDVPKPPGYDLGDANA